MESGLTKNQIIEQLTKSPHGDLSQFVPVGTAAAKQEPEFLAHLISWNRVHGQVRDSKVALPVLALNCARESNVALDKGWVGSNALAHLAMLSPRDLLRALAFARVAVRPEAKLISMAIPGPGRALARMVSRYLRTFEADPPRWDRVALQHRGTLKGLYARYHVKPGPRAEAVLFKRDRPRGSVFEAVANLKDMSPREAAGTILQRRIPYLIALGAAGAKMKEPEVALALIEQMSASELITNTKMLERLGMRRNPALRGAYEAALRKVPAAKVGTLKTTRAAEALDDEVLVAKLRAVQERQIDALGGIDGDWLICADRSPSMQEAIEFCRHLAAVLARFVKGKVHIVFFDNGFHQYVDATGMDLQTVTAVTSGIGTGGNGTSIGAALRYAAEKGLAVNGIAVVSDGAENTAPLFATAYSAYCKKVNADVPAYLYWMACKGPSPAYGPNDPETMARNMRGAGLEMQTFDLRGGFDYHSLPNIVKTMRTQRYGLVEQIMATPLLKLEDVLIEEVAHAGRTAEV